MNAQEASNTLDPEPAAIVGLVEKLVEGMWPRSDFDRKAWFERHGLVSGAAWDEASAAPAVAHYSLRTPMAGGEIASSWTSYNGRFLGISMQVYSSMQSDNPSTRQGYDDIHNRLITLYGEGTNPWHDPIVQACVWNVNGRRIVIRFFNLQHSGVMVSVDDAGLASASEAEARRRNAPAHWNNSAEALSPYVMPKLGAQK
ncbi:hypothetical protein [Arthrobacter psychrochitiniphilus]|uniref:Uncharacterized protein n=1 Tax=Arthrobacter psychrochitiniphilus TaxID=291045 RepID=A0A2V3DV20_9MICC|nr:hypothetical protein [Arthrobacter psychrochitiniphilus]NYG18852.1 hypothetical protein [Arthrobacter psychrochitiniphilus]PXA66237.1 hypothetical protein CVS29_05920 [Arthrobacter psychrochitiniphilus]